MSTPTRPFEFPDGFNSLYGVERMRIPEVLFNPHRFLPKEVRCPTPRVVIPLADPSSRPTVHPASPSHLRLYHPFAPLLEPAASPSTVQQRAGAD